MLTKQGLQFGNFQDFIPEQSERINTTTRERENNGSPSRRSNCLLIHSQG